MKRIAYISGFSDFIGGGEHSLFDLVTNLPNAYQPILITPEKGSLSVRMRESGITTMHLPMPPLGPGALLAMPAWFRLFKKQRPDLLHVNNSRAAFYAGVAGRWLGIPMIFHCRIIDRDRYLDWLLVRLATAIIANSRATAERFSSWPDVQPDVIYNGFKMPDLPCYSMPNPWGAGHVLLNVARLSRWKRHDILLQVFDRLAGAFPDLHLVCIGAADPLDTAWEHKLREHPLSCQHADRIHWLGHQDDPGPWYQMADIFALTSEHEPFGRVVVEAMAHAVPVVAFATGGVPEIIDTATQGRLVEEGDLDGFCDAIRQLLSDEGLRREMGEQGMARAACFSIASHVRRVCNLYDGLLDKHGAGH